MSSYTRIQGTVEIYGSSYGPEWTLAAIQKQAREESLQHLQNKLKGTGLKIIGEPKVLTHVDMEEKQGSAA